MTINCTQNETGFSCEIPTLDVDNTPNYIQEISYNEESSFYSNTWTNGELFISLAVWIFLVIWIFEKILSFFMPKIVRIRRKQ